MGKYFTIEELCYSATAKAKNIDNTPSKKVIDNLNTLITECLDPIREKFKRPIIVSSGYRCSKLNKIVKGASNSQHLTGQAADLVGRNLAETKNIFEIASEIGEYDQLLYEHNSKGAVWVHISYKSKGENRRMKNENYYAN